MILCLFSVHLPSILFTVSRYRLSFPLPTHLPFAGRKGKTKQNGNFSAKILASNGMLHYEYFYISVCDGFESGKYPSAFIFIFIFIRLFFRKKEKNTNSAATMCAKNKKQRKKKYLTLPSASNDALHHKNGHHWIHG